MFFSSGLWNVQERNSGGGGLDSFVTSADDVAMCEK